MPRDLFQEAGVNTADPRDLFADNGISLDKVDAGTNPSVSLRAADPIVASPLGRFMHGVGDPALGVAQLLSHATPYANQLGINQKLFNTTESEYQNARQRQGQDTSDYDAPRLAGNIVSPMNRLVPGGSGVAGAVRQGMAIGGMQPVTGNDDDFWSDKAKQTALGGSAAGILPGIAKITGAASSKVAKILADTNTKAAAEAAADTASARSAAGNAAQDAYRQLEHLRNLGARGLLTPEQEQVATQLEKELGGKAADKLLPAAAKKEATAKAYQEAMDTEAQRASKMASDKLSNSEVKAQIAARLKRYGPAVVGGMIGNSILPGVGTGAGIVAGLYLRPAVRSIMNLSKNPAVQYKLLSPVARADQIAKVLLDEQPYITPASAVLVNKLLQTSP